MKHIVLPCRNIGDMSPSSPAIAASAK